MWHSRPPRDPPFPPFMANTIFNFHFDYWYPSLIVTLRVSDWQSQETDLESIRNSCDVFFKPPPYACYEKHRWLYGREGPLTA